MTPTTRRYAQPATCATAPEGAPTNRHATGLAAAGARPLPPSLDRLLGTPIGTVDVPRSMFPNGPDRRAYIIQVEGACLRPKARHGDRIVVSPAAPLLRGAMVALHYRDRSRPPQVKQLVCPPMPGLLSATGQVGSNVRGLVLVEMLNPAQVFRIRLDELLAIHAVVGVLRPDECGPAPTTGRAAA